ncbi:MAG: type II secretion system minor pseudopilin GspK [Thermodesulfovibrionales bacterium]
MRRARPTLRDRSGLALVLTLAVLVMITALVVEFAYGVYVNTSFLRNWETSEKLSLAARSGVTLGAGLVDYALGQYSYTYPGTVDIPPTDPFSSESADSFSPVVALRIEDETSKFNVNSLVMENDELNEKAYALFERLLGNLGLDAALAGALADWIDRDGVPRAPDSETGAANAAFRSVDELLLVPGIDAEVYDKLKPYVTVYGLRNTIEKSININGAGLELIMALHKDMTAELAQRIVDRREVQPFKRANEVFSIPGLESGFQDLPITERGKYFRLSAVAASEDGIKRAVECVIDANGVIQFWKET